MFFLLLVTVAKAQTDYNIVDTTTLPVFENLKWLYDSGYEKTVFYTSSPVPNNQQKIRIRSQEYWRNANIQTINDTLGRFSEAHTYDECNIAVVDIYFVLKSTYRMLPYPNDIVIANTNYIVYVCQDCTKPNSEQLTEAYTLITQRACSNTKQ